MSACIEDTNLYFDPACSLTLDDHVDMVDDLLPQGPAWPRNPDSGLMRYWRSFAEVIKYAEDRICALAEEFYCDTSSETLDVWYEQYGLAPVDIAAVNAACVKPGFNPNAGLRSDLCAKLSAQGGGSCTYLVAVALAKGWVITCSDLSQTYVPPVAGCAIVGCTHLAEHMLPQTSGSCLGTSGLASGNFGAAVNAPNKADWAAGSPRNGSCPMPGSELGQNALGPDCCDFAGFYPTNAAPVGAGTSACSPSAAPRADVPAVGDLTLPSCTPLGGVFPQMVGDAFTVQITINVNASMLLLQTNSPFKNMWTLSGCMTAGDVCSPLRGDLLQDLKDLIDSIKPAHAYISYVLA